MDWHPPGSTQTGRIEDQPRATVTVASSMLHYVDSGTRSFDVMDIRCRPLAVQMNNNIWNARIPDVHVITPESTIQP